MLVRDVCVDAKGVSAAHRRPSRYRRKHVKSTGVITLLQRAAFPYVEEIDLRGAIE